MPNLDSEFLQYCGGVESNSFLNVLHNNTDEDEDIANSAPQINIHSPYYDFTDLIPTLAGHKDVFSILSSNIQCQN